MITGYECGMPLSKRHVAIPCLELTLDLLSLCSFLLAVCSIKINQFCPDPAGQPAGQPAPSTLRGFRHAKVCNTLCAAYHHKKPLATARDNAYNGVTLHVLGTRFYEYAAYHAWATHTAG